MDVTLLKKIQKSAFFTIFTVFTLSMFGIWGGACSSGQGILPDGRVDDGGTQQDIGAKDQTKPLGPITALSTETFVYIKYVRTSVSGSIGHIYGYNVATKKTWLISELDDSTSRLDISLSPDRKWIALRAFFRPNSEDLATKLTTPSIWLVSVDGKQFRRVTATIQNPNLKSAKCSVNSQCFTTNYCNTAWGRCSYKSYSIGLGKPEWSGDGKTLWFGYSTFWWSKSSDKLTGGSRPASVSASGGVLQLHTVSSGCLLVSSISVNPKKKQILAVHSVCSGSGGPGLHSYGIPPKSGTPLLQKYNISMGHWLRGSQFAWLPDGNMLLFNGETKWDLDGDGKAETQATGIISYNFTKKQAAPFLAPLQSHLDYGSFSIDPKGDKLVLCIHDKNKKSSDLFLFDPTNKKNPSQILTRDGKSCKPSW